VTAPYKKKAKNKTSPDALREDRLLGNLGASGSTIMIKYSLFVCLFRTVWNIYFREQGAFV
jgi:hypothetical protein